MDMTENVNREKLVTDARVVLDDVEALLKQAASAGGQQAQELRDRAAEALGRARVKLRDAQVAVGENAKAAARATDDWVHAHPWGAIGVGAGVGFLIGLLVARR
jgi:ElaB/YqjD/DUF883 family membrane-anchored ribosome-binding protein